MSYNRESLFSKAQIHSFKVLNPIFASFCQNSHTEKNPVIKSKETDDLTSSTEEVGLKIRPSKISSEFKCIFMWLIYDPVKLFHP